MTVPKYRRVLLKVSGEALMGSQSYGIDVATVERIAADVKDATQVGAQICMVVGGGNIFRGLSGAAAGTLLAYHPEPDQLVRLPALALPQYPVHLGAAGLRREETRSHE